MSSSHETKPLLPLLISSHPKNSKQCDLPPFREVQVWRAFQVPKNCLAHTKRLGFSKGRSNKKETKENIWLFNEEVDMIGRGNRFQPVALRMRGSSEADDYFEDEVKEPPREDDPTLKWQPLNFFRCERRLEMLIRNFYSGNVRIFDKKKALKNGSGTTVAVPLGLTFQTSFYHKTFAASVNFYPGEKNASRVIGDTCNYSSVFVICFLMCCSRTCQMIPFDNKCWTVDRDWSFLSLSLTEK